MPSIGDTKKMPCGSSECKNRKYSIWVWTSGFFGNYWKCSSCGRERG